MLNIVFGVWRLVGLLVSMLILVAVERLRLNASPLLNILQTHSFYRAWTRTALPIDFAATLVLIIAGIGLLLMKPRARKISIGYGIYAIVMAIVGMVVNFAVVLPALPRVASGGAGATGRIGAMIGTTLSGVLNVVYAALLIFFMTRPRVVEAFRPGGGPAGT